MNKADLLLARANRLSWKNVFALFICVTLISSFVGLSFQNNHWHPVAYGAGTPDSYGNQIGSIEYWQNSTGVWALVSSVTSSEYVYNIYKTIPSSECTIIYVIVWLNISFAATSDLAKANVRCHITISDVVANYEMQNLTAEAGPWYWRVLLTYPNSGSYWTPAVDTNYTVTVQYEAYW